MPSKFVRFDDGAAAQMLKKLSEDTLRSEGKMVAWLIREEFYRRYGFSADVWVAAGEEAEGEEPIEPIEKTSK